MNALPRFVARWISLAFLLVCQNGYAQECSKEALTAKYWQYRENLNKHFVMNDRKPGGCVGNGITRNEIDFATLGCGTDLLHGYGIPATSIIMDLDGGRTGMGDRINEGSIFFDKTCADAGPSPGFTFDHEGPRKFNFLEYGSETPHQIGWYLVTLATEYALLGQNGQLEEQQRTLEDIFLALQAYRRLDITANCLVKDRYDEITAGFEVEDCDIWVGNHHYTEDACLCAEKYHNDQCKGDGVLGVDGPDGKWNFDIPCKTNCPWAPNLSGYSGFYIREDAVQEQEGLHDASEDRWNIDLVGNAFAMSQSPPCEPNFSPTCYNEKKTNFLSHDQTFSILMGLAMVKRYLPPNATVITCDGTAYNPFNIVQEIANGMVKLPQNATRHVFWPGSSDDDCCYKAVKFGNCAGGNLQWTYAGIEYMFNYINEGDDDHKVGAFERLKWGSSRGREAFFSTAMSVGFDLGDFGSQIARNRVINTIIDNKKEIFLLMNDLFHPSEPNIMDDEAREELKATFEQMLCEAPCEGVCFKPVGYDNQDASWPEFDCANTPDWIGQRWEGYGYPPPNQEAWDARAARQYNGLDFMALYNTYMLNFPEEQTPYYNPDRPEPTTSGHLLGENQIEGPSTLCPGQSGNYKVLKTYSYASINSLLWSSSNNITFSSTTSNPTTATLTTALTPSFIEAKFNQNRRADQYYNGNVRQTEGYYLADPFLQYVPPQNVTISDICDFSYQKPIVTETPNYDIDLIIDECTWNYQANVFGSPIYDGITFYWTATDNLTGYSINYNGPYFDFFRVMPIGLGEIGTVTITLVIHSSCGNITKTVTAPYQTCNDPWEHRQIIINPNPTNNQVSIYIIKNQSQDFITTDPNGVRIQIYPANGGSTTLLDSYLYNNGQYFNVSSLPNGVYQVRASAADLTPIQANLSIIH